MKFTLQSFTVVAILSVFAEASLHNHHNAARHSKLARRGGSNGRCKPSGSSSLVQSSASPAPSKPPSNQDDKAGGSGGSDPVSSAVKGLINVKHDACGANGAVKDISKTAGPNGALEWLNCGIDGDGWNPPYITVDDIVSVDLKWAASQDGSPFKACAPYIWAFEQYAEQHGIPAILLASFAMQESTCNPATIGGAGEQGLMQLTADKCGEAPGGDCRDVNYNVKTGAAYFAKSLKDNDGNLALTIGRYNGWFKGMTYNDATKARWTSCCRCQNNLDYLHQFLNGWIQNYDAYTHGLGIYFNLNVC